MANYTSKHTGETIDAGIDKANGFPNVCVFEIYMTTSAEVPWSVQIIPYHSIPQMMLNHLLPFIYLDDMYHVCAGEDLPQVAHWEYGKATGISGTLCVSSNFPMDGTHTAGTTYKICIA